MLDFLYRGHVSTSAGNTFWNYKRASVARISQSRWESFPVQEHCSMFPSVQNWLAWKLETYLLCIEGGSGEHFYSMLRVKRLAWRAVLVESIASSCDSAERRQYVVSQLINAIELNRNISRPFFRHVACVT